MTKVPPNVAAIHPEYTEQQKAKLKAAAQDFEALFVQYMLKSMQDTENVDGQDDNGLGFGKNIMTGLFNSELSKYIAQNSNLGIGNMLYKQLTGEDMYPVVSQEQVQASDSALMTPSKVQATYDGAGSQLKTLQQIKAYSSGSVLENVGKYSDIVNEAAETYDLNPNLIKAVIAAESAGKPDSVSSKDAKGLMQLTDETAKELGVVNSFDPYENIMGGAKYLKSLLSQFSGNLPKALASYNAGPGAVEQYGGVPPYTETQNYVKRVMSYLNMFGANGIL